MNIKFLPYTDEECSLLLDFEMLQEDNYFSRYTTFTRRTANLHFIFRHFFLLSSKKYVVEYQNLVVTVPLHLKTEFVKYEIDPRHCKPEFTLNEGILTFRISHPTINHQAN